jgi:hypothetical protein
MLVVAHRFLLSWSSLLGLTLCTILFIPMKRYAFPASLPFHLEPYRFVVGCILVAWLGSLLIDQRLALRRSGFEAPIFALFGAILISIVANIRRVDAVGTDFVKTLTFFLSYFLIFWLIVNVVRRPRDIDSLVRLLVYGGGALGFFALVEQATNFNIFNHISSVFPLLKYQPGLDPELARGGRLRVYASAQHPIALGAAFAVLLPLAAYRALVSGQRRWWLAGTFMILGLLATRSRTGVLMLVAIGVIYIFLRPNQVKRAWPAVLPLLVAVHLVLPGTLGSLKESLFPKQGLVAEQTNAQVGSGRLATLGPALRHELVGNPISGEGFGTRISVPDQYVPVPNGPILDDQWLGIVLETGVLGTLAFAWLFGYALRRMGGAARRDFSPRGELLVALAAGVGAYAVGMFTYDAFAFIQVTFLVFIFLALGATTLLTPPEAWEEGRRLRRSGARPAERFAHANA